RALEMATKLYSAAVDVVVPVAGTRVAEAAKILENTFRAVNIALVNELKIVFTKMGIDVWDVIDAASTKPFGFMPFYPGPGIGGHCLPLDPIYLSWKAKTYGFYNRFIELASDINSNMPYYIVQRIADVLNLKGKALSTSEILCLGVAYKKNVSDTRESPGIEVMKMLKQHGAVVKYSDPYVPVIKEDGITDRSIEITKESLETADCVVLLTDHSSFDYDLIADHARLVLDTRNAFKGREKPDIFRIGTGLPTPEEFQSHVQLNGRVDCEGEVIE
ncbi:MAG TPA: nucleotide sugar dehydrogenase, partial [Coprothermobacter proteolyticus]|nr:nucleotide sugar dehydrogenase [Coprothermobacter proteolyticus]